MDTFTLIIIGFAVLFGGALIVGLIQGGVKKQTAKKVEARIRKEPNFNAADVYVSAFNGAGIAIDRDRREVILADSRRLRRFGISSIAGCEVLQDGAQIAYTNRGSQLAGIAVGGALLGGVGAVIGGLSGSRMSVNNIQKVVLRITTDDFDVPNHDIVLIDWSHSKKGLGRDNILYKTALETAELWHGRMTALLRLEQPKP